MATTYSGNYQIKLIGTGLEAGTWGDSTNLNFEKLEQAIGGSTTVTLDGSLPTGSSYSSNVLTLITNALVDPSDSGAEPRSHYIKITNGSAITAEQTVRFYGASGSSADRVFIVENALDLSSSLDSYGDLVLRSAGGSTGINLPYGSRALVYTNGTNLYNAISQLFVSSLDMSEAASDIVINGSNSSSLEILDNRLNGSNEFERDVYLRIGTDSTPSFDVFPTINTASEKADATFSVQADISTFGADTSGTNAKIRAKGNEGIVIEGGDTGDFASVLIEHGTNKEVYLKPHGTGQVVVGTGSANAVLRSNGTHDLILQAGTADNSTITITDAADGDITIAPNGDGGLLLTGDSYMNFSSTQGSGGYGLRSNSSVLEVSATNTDGWGQSYHTNMTSGQGSYYSATNSSLSNSTAAYAFSHGFSAIPVIVKYYLQNNTGSAIAGYDDTDMIDISGWSSNSYQDDTRRTACTTWLTSSQVGISFFLSDPSTDPFFVLNKSSGALVDIDLADWDLIVRAWK